MKPTDLLLWHLFFKYFEQARIYARGSEHDLIAWDERYAQRSGSNREAKYNHMLGQRSAALLLSWGKFVYFCFFSVVAEVCSLENTYTSLRHDVQMPNLWFRGQTMETESNSISLYPWSNSKTWFWLTWNLKMFFILQYSLLEDNHLQKCNEEISPSFLFQMCLRQSRRHNKRNSHQQKNQTQRRNQRRGRRVLQRKQQWRPRRRKRMNRYYNVNAFPV